MAGPVRVYLRVPGTAPVPDLVKLLQGVETAGFDGAGILDSQMICRDTFVTLGQAAVQTSRMTLFPAVTNPFTRHASVLAGGIQSVEELAPGRVKFVIGTGYTSASTIGRKAATLAEMRACIGTVKALLAGQSVDFDGTPGRLVYASGRSIPVIMAASGPKALEVAGEVADGVMALVGFNRGIVQTALDHIERGAKRSGRHQPSRGPLIRSEPKQVREVADRRPVLRHVGIGGVVHRIGQVVTTAPAQGLAELIQRGLDLIGESLGAGLRSVEDSVACRVQQARQVAFERLQLISELA